MSQIPETGAIVKVSVNHSISSWTNQKAGSMFKILELSFNECRAAEPMLADFRPVPTDQIRLYNSPAVWTTATH